MQPDARIEEAPEAMPALNEEVVRARERLRVALDRVEVLCDLKRYAGELAGRLKRQPSLSEALDPELAPNPIERAHLEGLLRRLLAGMDGEGHPDEFGNEDHSANGGEGGKRT